MKTLPSMPLSLNHWGVLKHEWVWFEVRKKGGALVSSSYEFKLDVVPQETGFQIAVNNGICDWDRPPDASTQSSPWNSPERDIIMYAQWQQVVRCGLGTGSGDIRVMGRDGPSGSPFTISTVRIKKAWHRTDGDVSYYIKGSQGDGALFPPDDTRQPNALLLQHSNYEAAANAWDAINAGVTFTRVSSAIAADVGIVGYWDPYLTTTPQKSDNVCGASVACTVNRRDILPHLPSNPVDYPYMGYQTFYIEEPPRWGIGDSKKWTINFKDAIDRPNKFVYLPSVLMHEFGHTMGLGHSASGVSDVMNGGIREIEPCGKSHAECGLSINDRKGAKSIYQP